MRGPRTIAGRYTRLEDGVTFDYSITYSRAAERGTAWFSRVVCNDTLRGRPSGKLDHRKIPDVEIAEQVRKLVEIAIRNREGVS